MELSNFLQIATIQVSFVVINRFPKKEGKNWEKNKEKSNDKSFRSPIAKNAFIANENKNALI